MACHAVKQKISAETPKGVPTEMAELFVKYDDIKKQIRYDKSDQSTTPPSTTRLSGLAAEP